MKNIRSIVAKPSTFAVLLSILLLTACQEFTVAEATPPEHSGTTTEPLTSEEPNNLEVIETIEAYDPFLAPPRPNPNPDLRAPTPPLNLIEFGEVGMAFFNRSGGRQGLNITEVGDLSDFAVRAQRWWFDQNRPNQLGDHTLIIWPDEPLSDFKVVSLGFDDSDPNDPYFYVRHELLHQWWTGIHSYYFLNINVLHYLIPRVGVTFTDDAGTEHRILISESMAGYPYPRWHLIPHDDNHWIRWDDSRAPQPIAIRGWSEYEITGLGARLFMSRRQPYLFIGNGRFEGITGLADEWVEGASRLVPEGISVEFAVARNTIIIEYTDGPLGTLAGPAVMFTYNPHTGHLSDVRHHPFVFHDDAHPPLHFDMPEQGMIEMAHALLLAFELVEQWEQ